jgi:hypothetical protein
MHFLIKGPQNRTLNYQRRWLKPTTDIVLTNRNGWFFLKSNGLGSLYGSNSENVDLPLLMKNVLADFNSQYDFEKIQKNEINEQIGVMSFSDIDKKLLKKIYKYPLVYPKFGEKYNTILSHARYLLETYEMKVAFDLIVNSINPLWTEGEYMAYVKDFGTYCLEAVINRNYPLVLLNYVEIHMLSGYDTYLHRKFDILRDVEPFVKPRELDNYYRDLFKQAIDETVKMLNIGQYPNLNFEDYVKYRDNWNLMGSSTLGLPMKIKTEGFRKATRIGSKTTNLIYYDDKTLIEQLLKAEGHIIKPFLKTDEAAKSRVVIGYDTRSYVRVSFLEAFIDSFNGQEKWTTVGDDPATLYQVREKVNDNIKSNKYQMVCTDQSAFDQHQYKSLFVYTFNAIAGRILKLNPQVRKIIELENYGMNHAYILCNNKKLPWNNGLLSGHRWTALIGSILNRSATLTAARLANISLKFGVFQGDDALVFMDKKDNYLEFLKGYEKLGLVANPMKTWHGSRRTEYLHQVYIKDRVIALSMRACLGLMFKDPKSLEVAPDQDFLATIDQFRLASRRGLKVDNLAFIYTRKMFKKYIPNSDLLNVKSLAFDYLHTPTLYGGGGFETYVKPKLYKTLSFIKEFKDLRSEIITPYHYIINGNKELTKKWIFKKIYAHLPQPGITTTFKLNKVDFSVKTTRPPLRAKAIESGFDKKLKDNSLNWVRNVKEIVGDTCAYGDEYVKRFSKIRSSIRDSFNLISNITAGFISKIDNKIWGRICKEVVGLYTLRQFTIFQALSHLEYHRQLLLKKYRTQPPSWYKYGFFF